jgi:hypothetical protein
MRAERCFDLTTQRRQLVPLGLLVNCPTPLDPNFPDPGPDPVEVVPRPLHRLVVVRPNPVRRLAPELPIPLLVDRPALRCRMDWLQNLELPPEVHPGMLLAVLPAVLLQNPVVVRRKQRVLPGNFVAEERTLRTKAILDID